MIKVGLTTWTDHPFLADNQKAKITLPEYSDYFSIVEVDSPFYAIPKIEWVKKWLAEVPHDFQFIVKANSAMTKTPMGKQPEDLSEGELQQLFVKFRTVFQPMLDSHQLASFLFQFPPSFPCNQVNVQYLRQIRKWMGNAPISFEFRNASWLSEKLSKKTDAFLTELKITEVIVDEPHNLSNGLPFHPVITNQQLVYVRLHGHNEVDWAKGTRERYRYRYQKAELEEIAQKITTLAQSAKEVVVIFNNNTGKDAAENAMMMKQILHLKANNLATTQLDLFQ
ncbi:DUF72 domain-containing protein [Fructilactobacillus sp. Tb1]|uniref:DUF72 domain-containing protein n=1 Tax=Fructilactobacillus sp. Tb1 TaxID=3422304 RepID=UPI003D29796B